MKKFLGQEPAFPLVNESNNDAQSFCHDGMSKRLYIAAMAMQGMLANSKLNKFMGAGNKMVNISIDEVAEIAFFMSDELLKQEAEAFPITTE